MCTTSGIYINYHILAYELKVSKNSKLTISLFKAVIKNYFQNFYTYTILTLEII